MSIPTNISNKTIYYAKLHPNKSTYTFTSKKFAVKIKCLFIYVFAGNKNGTKAYF